MIINELLRRWFRLDPIHCESCEVLREQLSSSERERRELLTRLLEKDKPEPLPSGIKEEEPIAITPQFVPWRVRQQLLEQEDRKTAALMRDRKKEIADLEKELGVAKDVSSPSGGINVQTGS